MSLRDTVFRCWIVGTSFQRPKRSLTGDTALQLLLHFLCGALLERVCAAVQSQPYYRKRN